MNISLRKSLEIVSFVSVFFLTACGGDAKKNDPNHIKVGIESGPEYSIAQVAQKVAKDKYNLEVELVQFNDYVMPNEALHQGDIDANAFQNKPILMFRQNNAVINLLL